MIQAAGVESTAALGQKQACVQLGERKDPSVAGAQQAWVRQSEVREAGGMFQGGHKQGSSRVRGCCVKEENASAFVWESYSDQTQHLIFATRSSSGGTKNPVGTETRAESQGHLSSSGGGVLRIPLTGREAGLGARCPKST